MNLNPKITISLSVIIPVYNRPDEIIELLDSLSNQTNKNFEIVIVEDGSTLKCDTIIEKYASQLKINYFFISNSGPAVARNYGMNNANGNYFVFVDSDCIIPKHYIQTVLVYLEQDYVDAFGGPDASHPEFNSIQKSVSYAMTSFYTTGGIRGGGENLDKFYPRSFNMGISKLVFEKTGGFPLHRFANSKAAGEDLDLSIQIYKLGFKVKLFADAFVYHKRRTSLKQFFFQVYNFGLARISIYKRHPESLKLMHTLPTIYILGVLIMFVLSIFISNYLILPFILYCLIILFDSSIKNRNVYIGLLSVITSNIQLIGYGYGFLVGAWTKIIFPSKS